MRRRQENIQAIVQTLELDTTPGHAFRALTSQTELRRWWAPRVISARGIVSVEEGKDIEMKLLQQETNRLVRYNWRPKEWEEEVPETILTFEIEDLGVSRSETGEGILLTVTHDGWVDGDSRSAQAQMLTSALRGFRELLEKKKAKPWWKQPGARTGYTRIQIAAVKEFCDELEKAQRGRSEKKLAAQNLWKLSQQMDGRGEWAELESPTGFVLKQGDRRVFGIESKGNVLLFWPDVEAVIGKRKLKEYANRLALEQDVDVVPTRKQEMIPAARLHIDLLVRWLNELLEDVRLSESGESPA